MIFLAASVSEIERRLNDAAVRASPTGREGEHQGPDLRASFMLKRAVSGKLEL